MTTFVTRAEWGARPPDSTPTAITSEGTTGHWEGGGIWGGVIGSHDRCATIVRGIQAYHMDHQGWSDVAYNALACPHDFLFEGRGPGRRSAANGTNTANGRSAVVCYLGGQGDPFTDGGKRAMFAASVYLLGALRWDHGDWFNTQCAGPEIRPWIDAGAPSPDPIPTPQEEEVAQGNAWSADGKRYYIIGRGLDDNVWIKRWNAETGQWSPDWSPIPPGGGGGGPHAFTGAPSVACGPGGRVDVEARGNDGALWRNTLVGDAWSGWASDGGQFH